MDLTLIPEHMRHVMVEWVNNGTPHPSTMGSFLRAMLCHDVWTAALRADEGNGKSLSAWVRFLYWEVPSGCHGSMPTIVGWYDEKKKEREARAVSRGDEVLL